MSFPWMDAWYFQPRGLRSASAIVPSSTISQSGGDWSALQSRFIISRTPVRTEAMLAWGSLRSYLVRGGSAPQALGLTRRRDRSVTVERKRKRKTSIWPPVWDRIYSRFLAVSMRFLSGDFCRAGWTGVSVGSGHWD